MQYQTRESDQGGLVLNAAPNERIYIIDQRTGESIELHTFVNDMGKHKIRFRIPSNYLVLREEVIKRGGRAYDQIKLALSVGETLTQGMMAKLGELKR